MNRKKLMDNIKKIKYSDLEYDSPERMLDDQKNLILNLVEQLDESPITDEQAWNKIAEAYPRTVQSLRITLDHAVFGNEAEPQKVKVPAFVAEWIEYVKKKGDSLYDSFKPWDLYGAEYVDEDRWIANNGEEYARAWLEGYEVEEEPKWVVYGERGYLTSLSISKGKSTGWTGNADKHGSGAIHFDDKEMAQYTAYIAGGTVEKV